MVGMVCRHRWIHCMTDDIPSSTTLVRQVLLLHRAFLHMHRHLPSTNFPIEDPRAIFPLKTRPLFCSVAVE